MMGIPCFYGDILSGTNLFPFLSTYYTWAFNDKTQLGATFNWLNLAFDSVCTAVEMGFNIMSLTWVHRMRKRVQNMPTEENWRREVKLLIQCVILGCIFTATYLAFTVVSAFKLVTLTSCLVMQGIWTFNHCVNPIVYLTVNQRLRKRAVQFIFGGKVRCDGSPLWSMSNNNYTPIRGGGARPVTV